MKRLSIILTAALAFTACSSDDDETKPEETPVEVNDKDTYNSAGYKADCLDCDENGPNAFVQLDIGTEFWKVGQSWQVVYQLNTDTRVQMQAQQQIGPAQEEVGFIVLDFEVIDSGTRVIGTSERATATLKITQGNAPGTIGQLIEGSIVRADEVTAAVELELDDLFRPVSVTEYSGPRGSYPNGRTLQLDWRDAVRSFDSAFPYVVPNAKRAGKTVAPVYEPTGLLGQVAEAANVTGEAFFFDIGNEGANSAEQVYWRAGDLWPTVVRTGAFEGVLINQNK